MRQCIWAPSVFLLCYVFLGHCWKPTENFNKDSTPHQHRSLLQQPTCSTVSDCPWPVEHQQCLFCNTTASQCDLQPQLLPCTLPGGGDGYCNFGICSPNCTRDFECSPTGSDCGVCAESGVCQYNYPTSQCSSWTGTGTCSYMGNCEEPCTQDRDCLYPYLNIGDCRSCQQGVCKTRPDSSSCQFTFGTGQCRFGVCRRECSVDGDCGGSTCQQCQGGRCLPVPDGGSCTMENQAGTCTSGLCMEHCGPPQYDCGGNTCFTCESVDSTDLCVPFTNSTACQLTGGGQGTCGATLETFGVCQNSVVNDPVIGGFDGKRFHYDEVGNFSLISEGRGWRVDATFSAAPKVEGAESRESSWTTGVRVHSPGGNMVSCALPAVHPNTSVMTVTAESAAGTPALLTPQRMESALSDMTASATLSWKQYAGVQYSAVVGCKVSTPLMDINVYQVSGWEEAQARPEEHGWAAPFTWLNIDFTLHKRLAAPVTGIMGETYPAEGSLPGDASVATACGQALSFDTSAAGGCSAQGSGGAAEGAAARSMLGEDLPLAVTFTLVGLRGKS